MGTKPAISVQLYTLHREFDADPEGALSKLASIGLRNVEAFDFVRRADQLAESFGRHGIATPTGHTMLVAKEFTFQGVTRPVASHQETFEAAQKLGMKYVIDPAVRGDWSSADEVAATAAALNEAARKAADFGMQVGYHNHAWEISNTIDGTIALEVLADHLDDNLVLEVDLYWAFIGGADVPALLGRLGDRVKAVHVKDGPSTANPFTPTGPVAIGQMDAAALGQRPAGEGDVPLADSLDTATGLEFAVIEYDAFAGDIFDGIAASYAYLQGRA